jgi:hypothetical protein
MVQLLCRVPGGLHMDVNNKRVTLNAGGRHPSITEVPHAFWHAWEATHQALVSSGAVTALD